MRSLLTWETNKIKHALYEVYVPKDELTNKRDILSQNTYSLLKVATLLYVQCFDENNLLRIISHYNSMAS